MTSLTGALLLANAVLGAVFGPARPVPDVEPAAMAVDLEGDRLYVAAGTHLTVFDVSEPLKPVRLGAFAGVDNRRQLAVRDGFVYLVSRETGLRIIDCTDPRHPRLRSRFDSVEFATGIDVVGHVAYLSERINGVEVVDVSDPDRPFHVAIHKTPESQSNRYHGGYLYSGEWGVGQVTVFDAHDLKAIRPLGHVDLHGYGDGLDVADGLLYCSTGHDARRTSLKGEAAVGRGRGLEIFSLADPAHPQPVGRVAFPTFKPREDDYWTVRVSGKRAFCADSHNGLFAVDVSDPAKPKVVDRFCVPQKSRPDWPSAAISSLAVGEGCLYVAAKPGGLYVVPVGGLSPSKRGSVPLASGGQTPEKPGGQTPVEQVAGLPTGFSVYRPTCRGQARTAVARGDVVYAAFGDAGLHVLRIGESGFVKLGELPNRQVYDCAFSGNGLLTAEGTDGFALYELDGPTGFREVARRPQLSSEETVAFWTWALPNGPAILSGRNGPMRFVRLDELSKGIDLARFVFSCQWDKYVADRPLDGRLPVAVPGRALVWLDLMGPTPVEVRRDATFTPRQTNGVCTFGDKFFLATDRKKYVFLRPDGTRDGDVRSFPGLELDEGGVPRSDGRFVALTARSAHGLALYDFADRASPKLIGQWKLAGNPDLATFGCGRLIVPAGHQGLLMR